MFGYDYDTAAEVAEHIWQVNNGSIQGIAHDIALETRLTYDEAYERLKAGQLDALARIIEEECDD